jgi:DNA-binding CsgD family transcriptional regulator
VIAWAEDLLVSLAQVREAKCVFEQIGESARRLGFEQCAYGFRHPLPFTNPRTHLINNYDPRWWRRYEDAHYLAIDPTVLHAVRSHEPVLWSDELFRAAPQLWAEARSFGLRVGWAQSCFDGDGAVGLLSLARSHDKLTPAELAAKEPFLRWLTNVAHTALSDALAGKVRPRSLRLTPREIEVLQWTADGKTSSEVADILNVSTDTVNFHIKNAILKLQVANKAAAVARAAVLGLLA